MNTIAAIIDASCQLGAATTLKQLGLTAGELSFRKAREVYGAWFTKAVKDHRLHPVHICDGNGKQVYSVTDILALKVEDAARAELYLKQSNSKAL